MLNNSQRRADYSRYGDMSMAQDQGLRAHMLAVYNYMAMALVLTGIVAFAASTSEQLMTAIFTTPLKWVVALAPLGVVFYLRARMHNMSQSAAQGWFWAFATLMGLSLSTIFLVYTGTSIARTFFVTSAAFASLSLYGYTTKKDLSGMGSFLIMSVFGLIIASVVNIFLQSSGLHFAITCIGVVIFSALTAYDTQRIKYEYYAMGAQGNSAIRGALSLYIDFIVLFQYLLSFLGSRE